MDVLVAFDSRSGATAGIADVIAEVLGDAGHAARSMRVEDVADIDGHDAFVIGSAVYFGHWRRGALAFVRDHRSVLASRPTWLFSSGPLDASSGFDAEESEQLPAAELSELVELIRPREHAVFAGALDPARLPLRDRAIRRLPDGPKLLPEGDFRSWPDIRRWATRIAEELHAHDRGDRLRSG